MALASDRKELLLQNLQDAKCPVELTKECMILAADGRFAQMLARLKKQRKNLLDEIHDHQKALDCLDYLIFQIEKQ